MSRALAPKSSSIRYLDAASLRIWRPAGATAPRVEIRDDRTVLTAAFKRAFPMSEPDRYLCLQEADGTEVGVLRDLNGLEPASRTVLDAELDRRYYTPRIDRIHGLVQEAGMWKFEVDTQRGAKTFFVRNWRDSAHEATPGRWHILSVDGARFEIPDLGAMDERSLRLMDQLL